MLHFAYGSNMDPASMRRRCPTAVAMGRARLNDWRFIVTRDGYASIVRAPGAVVHGVLWRLGPRDLAAINAYETGRYVPSLRTAFRIARLFDKKIGEVFLLDPPETDPTTFHELGRTS